MEKLNIPLVRTSIGEEEIEATVRVMRSGQLAAGPEVAAFEKAFASEIGVRHAVAVNSGTAALHCALNAAGVGPGDEVITTPFTFAATATPILMLGARPVFVDIDPRTFNADLQKLRGSITPRTKAVVFVDLFGLPCDTNGIEDLRSLGIAVVEDACQAVGASRNGVQAGALGDVGCFSFYATKNMMTGEGGMLVTDRDDIASSARRFRQHGQGERYEYLSLGFNYRMTDLAAAIGNVQLAQLSKINGRRRENAAQYDSLLADIPGVSTPFVPPDVLHCYHQYSILVDRDETKNGRSRDEVRAALAERGIGSGIYYPTPLHKNPLFADLGYSEGAFPVSEATAAKVLALPIHPLLTKQDVEAVANAIEDIVGE